tara:strand:+ start:617 stop:814 length:198 start_codon:yes stop_codon:yes gene_type:complete
MEEEISEGLTIEDINRKRNLMLLGVGIASYLVYTKYNKIAGVVLGVGGFLFVDFGSEVGKMASSK